MLFGRDFAEGLTLRQAPLSFWTYAKVRSTSPDQVIPELDLPVLALGNGDSRALSLGPCNSISQQSKLGLLTVQAAEALLQIVEASSIWLTFLPVEGVMITVGQTGSM